MSSTILSAGDPVYFFREYDHPYGFLSQWFESSFTAPSPDDASKSVVFRTTEQYMMYHKALLFRDIDTAQQIMLATTPRKQKALGRKVKNFDGKQWDAHREQIVENGNWNKFCHSKDGTNLKDMLLGTGDRELVEARATGRSSSLLCVADLHPPGISIRSVSTSSERPVLN